MKNSNLIKFSLCLCVSVSNFFSSVVAQENPPTPTPPRSVKIPAVHEKSLPNGLKVVVVERKNVPLVTASLLVKGGAYVEDENIAGVVDMTASLLLKGTKKRTATQIAEEMEFLGGNINSGATWISSNVTVNVTSDKLDKALAIISDVVLNPTFAAKEIRLYKTQTLDDLNVQLKQPSALANFAASRYTYGEHSAIGTSETISKITRKNISDFYRTEFKPTTSVLIFTGDISQKTAMMLANKYFRVWKDLAGKGKVLREESHPNDTLAEGEPKKVDRILVVDLPNSGQAAVTYAKKLYSGRAVYDKNGKATVSDIYYPALVTNSVLGGGYTNRLNLEIRIKRGLSYGARSNITWRHIRSNFSAGAQTKNISAAEVAELLATEIDRIGNDLVSADELKPRTATLKGNFSRALETTDGLARQISELYLYGINTSELNSYTQNLQNVTAAQVEKFAAQNLKGGDIIIVGNAKIFMDDLKKRFPNQKIEVISASDLDLNRDDLRKTQKTIRVSQTRTKS